MTANFSSKNKKQRQCIEAFEDSVTREIIYGGAKMCGKSYLGCYILMLQAMRYAGTHYFIARKRLTDIMKFLLPSVMEVSEHYNLNGKFTINNQRNIIHFKNGSKIFLLEASHNPSDPFYTRFGSMQMTQGWIEEAGEITKEAKVNLQASIGRWKNEEYGIKPKLLQTCNPSNNYLYDYYRDFHTGRLPNDTVFISALPTDNPYCTSEYTDNLRKSLPESIAKRLLEGRWEFDEENNIFKLEEASKAFDKSTRTVGQNRYLSIDVALEGKDHCVGILMYGDLNNCIFEIVLDKETNKANELVTAIRLLQDTYLVPVSKTVFDAIGVGSYLSSYIDEAKPFNANRAVAKTYGYKTEQLYRNARAECIYLLGTLINEKKCNIICNEKQKETILREFSSCYMIYNDNVLDVTHKKEQKEMIGHSPDYLDAMYMCMSFFIGAKRTPKNIAIY